MSKIDDTDAAFPAPEASMHDFGNPCVYKGMTLRQYAAIKLRVPDSGTDWLDEMIRQSLRDELATSFVERAQSLCQTGDGGWDLHNAAQCCYAMADAMLKERGK